MLAAGTSGQVLRSNGAAAPSWLTLATSATTDTTNAGNITSGTLANARTTATSANTANAIVARDASGNFSAGTITANLTGTASGNAPSTGIAPSAITGTAVITTDSRLSDARTPTAHNHDDRYYTEIEMGTLLSGKADIVHNQNAATITTGILDNARTTATSANTASAIVARDANGDFYAGSIFSRKSSFSQADISLYAAIPSGAGAIGLIDIGQQNSNVGEKFLGFYHNGSLCGTATRNGANSVAYTTTSDYRLKTNIEPLTDAVARLLQIPAHRFNWLADPSGQKVDGFLAHEAQAVVPEAVTGTKDAVDADGKPIYQGIDQSKLVPLLVAAVQELAARVAALEAK
jgi:hypothetical protein